MTASRTGGCGCGGTAHAPGGCGCEEKAPRTVYGGCGCAEPERRGVPCLERPVYSAGQLLTADALRLGQRYVNDRLALRRYVDGVGIVCGMHVRCDPGQPGWVIVDPGYAVDARGDDVALCEPVRFDLCKAIAECPRPQIPCDDDVQPLPRVEVGPVQLDKAYPGDSTVGTGEAVVSGVVTDRYTGNPVAGVFVRADGTTHTALTNASGGYTLVLPAGDYTLSAQMEGYRVTTRPAQVAAGYLTPADLALVPQRAAEQRRPAPPSTRTFVLRAESVWEGREPVAVVTRPGSTDPRPECRDSREAGTIRLCVQPLQEASPEQRAADRRHRFRQQGRTLLERLNQALEGAGSPVDQERAAAGDPRLERVVDALLRWVREHPPRAVCGTVTLLCELRRAIRGEPLKCGLPDEVRANPGHALVQIVGQLVDDLREGFLSLPCDDCVPHPGVRLAHVVVDDRLAGCAGTGCHVAGIDTHPPAREALHPAGDWWRGDRVALFDAYFRPVDEAGVLLTARGLRAFWRDAAYSGYTPDLPWRVWEWMASYGGEGELRRLGVYQQSELYAGWSAEVVMWTVDGRVVSIEPWSYYVESAEERFSMDRYLQRPLRAAADVRRAEEREVSWVVTPSGPAVEVSAPAPPVTKTPEPAPEKDAAAELAALDPAPLRELIRGIGPKIEAELFRNGIRTLRALEAAEYEQVHDALSGNLFLTPELFAGLREQAREYLGGARTVDARELEAWAAAARRRLAQAEGRAS